MIKAKNFSYGLIQLYPALLQSGPSLRRAVPILEGDCLQLGAKLEARGPCHKGIQPSGIFYAGPSLRSLATFDIASGSLGRGRGLLLGPLAPDSIRSFQTSTFRHDLECRLNYTHKLKLFYG